MKLEHESFTLLRELAYCIPLCPSTRSGKSSGKQPVYLHLAQCFQASVSLNASYHLEHPVSLEHISENSVLRFTLISRVTTVYERS